MAEPQTPAPGRRLGRLSEPSTVQHASFLEALVEHHAEGLHLDLGVEDLRDPARFTAWLEQLRRDGLAGASGDPWDRVPHRVLWWAAGPVYLGRLRLNLQLSEGLRDFGGHIGYDVRPSVRGRGHASAMLAAALEVAAAEGLGEVLLTCAPDNTASVRVIERNGGRLVDTSPAGRLWFLCATA